MSVCVEVSRPKHMCGTVALNTPPTKSIRGPRWPSGQQVWHLITGLASVCGFDSHK